MPGPGSGPQSVMGSVPSFAMENDAWCSQSPSKPLPSQKTTRKPPGGMLLLPAGNFQADCKSKVVVVERKKLCEAVDEPMQAIMDATKLALAETPPELAQDLLEMGIHLVGGGALLRGMDQRIEHETGVPVRLSELPLETVVLGAGRCLESFDRLREMFMDRPRGSSTQRRQ